MTNPVRLDRLSRGEKISGLDGMVTIDFQAKYQRTMEAIEDALNSVIAAQNAADAANAAAAAAETAAGNAQTAADNAQNAAEGAGAASSLATSGVSGLTMTATDAGANATITISAHTRIYGDGTSVAVSGGSITGLAYTTGYYVYYVQPSRAGGAVTYQATTNLATAAQTGDTHSLGAVTTPAAAGGPIGGNNNLPPGVQEP
jgi:hypothetical protein